MLFSVPSFLFLFLPVVLAAYLIPVRWWRNLVLLVASLIFYAWGAMGDLLVLIVLIVSNFLFGLLLSRYLERAPVAKCLVACAITLNVGLLAFYKIGLAYFPLWLQRLNWSMIANTLTVDFEHYPIGISFLTFQTISYILDVYHRRVHAEANPFHFALYVALFPKMIAGPIVRYREISGQLDQRSVTWSAAASGARRFSLGLAKKVLIADIVGAVSNRAFVLHPSGLGFDLAWLGLVCYALQIYYDFSGYSDMAIGLAQIFGFRFGENFNLPYVSRSISEFWRRWHITLSNWFRDYVFFPLERKRRGGPGYLQSLNIMIVFLLTGLWHGVTPNFIVWGGLHGAAIAMEQSRPGKRLKSMGGALQYVYAMMVVLIGWVFFRAENVAYALRYLAALVGYYGLRGELAFSVMPPVDHTTWLAIFMGAFFASPAAQIVGQIVSRFMSSFRLADSNQLAILQDVLILFLFGLSIVNIASMTHQAYIYMRF